MRDWEGVCMGARDREKRSRQDRWGSNGREAGKHQGSQWADSLREASWGQTTTRHTADISWAGPLTSPQKLL